MTIALWMFIALCVLAAVGLFTIFFSIFGGIKYLKFKRATKQLRAFFGELAEITSDDDD